MFAVVMYFDDFNGIVPLDSFKRYQRVLIEDGNHEVISQASSDEFNEYAKSHPKMDSKKLMDKLSDIGVKWDKIGIRYGDVESYADLGSYYHVEYLTDHQPKDSIKSLEYYQKAWEHWHMSERIRRDMNAGIVPLIKGRLPGCAPRTPLCRSTRKKRTGNCAGYVTSKRLLEKYT